MKIAIVKQMTKTGERNYAYRAGLLSRLNIFCPFNKIIGAFGSTREECIEAAIEEMKPDPPPNSKLISVVEI